MESDFEHVDDHGLVQFADRNCSGGRALQWGGAEDMALSGNLQYREWNMATGCEHGPDAERRGWRRSLRPRDCFPAGRTGDGGWYFPDNNECQHTLRRVLRSDEQHLGCGAKSAGDSEPA